MEKRYIIFMLFSFTMSMQCSDPAKSTPTQPHKEKLSILANEMRKLNSGSPKAPNVAVPTQFDVRTPSSDNFCNSPHPAVQSQIKNSPEPQTVIDVQNSSPALQNSSPATPNSLETTDDSKGYSKNCCWRVCLIASLVAIIPLAIVEILSVIEFNKAQPARVTPKNIPMAEPIAVAVLKSPKIVIPSRQAPDSVEINPSFPTATVAPIPGISSDSSDQTITQTAESIIDMGTTTPEPMIQPTVTATVKPLPEVNPVGIIPTFPTATDAPLINSRR